MTTTRKRLLRAAMEAQVLADAGEGDERLAWLLTTLATSLEHPAAISIAREYLNRFHP